MYIGRLLAIGLVSAVIAGVPVALIKSLHSRKFVYVAYEGSPDWRRQLRKWRRADTAIWVFGLGYCAFTVNFIVLFFANVAAKDQEDWMISASISLNQEFVIVPVAVGFIVSLMAMGFLAVAACRSGLRKSDFTQDGSLDRIREMFRRTSQGSDMSQFIAEHPGHAAFVQPEAMQPWGELELSMYHDAGPVDLGRLQPRIAGLGAA
jgi:hypothetical protein